MVKELRPKISIIENVPGMLNMKIIKKENNKIEKDVFEIYETIKKLKAKKIAYIKKQQSDFIKQIDKDITMQINKRDKLKKCIESNLYSVVEHIESIYNDLGYKVYKKVLCCADYGSATSRKRLFIIAIQNDINKEWTFPLPTHNQNGKQLEMH